MKALKSVEEKKEGLKVGKTKEEEKKGLATLEKVFSTIIDRARKDVVEGRKLKYEEDEVGITSLLQCPYKVELRKKFPEIRTEATAIDDGLRFEVSIKNACQLLFKGRVYEEFELPYESHGQKIRGHLDLVIEGNREVVGFELKAPQIIFLKRMPLKEHFDTSIIYDSEREDKFLIVNPTYKLQAKIEKFLLQELFDKPVRLFLFQSGLCKFGTLLRKFYTFYEVEAISKEELDYLVLRFVNDKSPRFQNECELYCCYNFVCDKKEEVQESQVLYDLDEELEKVTDPTLRESLFLYKQYCELKESMKHLEKTLKKSLVSAVRIGGKEIGWVEREVVEYDVDAIVEFLKRKNVPLGEFLNVTFSPKKRKLIETIVPNVVLKRDKQKVFKL